MYLIPTELPQRERFLLHVAKAASLPLHRLLLNYRRLAFGSIKRGPNNTRDRPEICIWACGQRFVELSPPCSERRSAQYLYIDLRANMFSLCFQKEQK